MALYKHKNNTDVAFELIKKFYVKQKDLYKMKVMWWRVNKANKVLYCMNIIQNIKIKRDSWRSEWEIIDE